MKAGIALLFLVAFAGTTHAQTIWVPGGVTTGVADNTSNSNVGIGTSTPGAKLELKGDELRVRSVVGKSDTTARTLLRLTSDNAISVSNLQLEFQLQGGSADGARYALIQAADFGYGWASLALNPHGGNVGIGTASPARKLEVSSAGSVYSKVTSTNSFDAAVQFSAAGYEAYIGRLPTSGGGTGTLDFFNGGVRMVIAPSGNVGIGTTSPSHKLAVNGSIRATEVIVDTGWADHVFADDYRLPTLSEVEEHIRTKRHLPGLPSAKEIAESGVSVGEMQAKLLEKIEELTLHVIAQQGQIEALRRELAEIKNAPPQ